MTKMTKQDKIDYLTRFQSEYINKYSSLEKDCESFATWRAKFRGGLVSIFSAKSTYVKEFTSLGFKQIRLNGAQASSRADIVQCRKDQQKLAMLFETMLEEVKTCNDESPNTSDVENIKRICRRFQRAIVPLQNRRSGEKHPDYQVNDEQDVQDLFHSVLAIYYDDVKPEEPVPSLAGNSTIIDFLLSDHNIAIEVKHTKKGNAQKKYRDELLVDIPNYFLHDKCKHLICFVFDTAHVIDDSIVFEKDIEKSHTNVHVVVLQ